MVANLFGDFVKGKDYSYLPEIVQQGVLLHRQIDDFIDRHPSVTQLRLKLYKELPKIAGIAIDLYFDHLLAKNWSEFHPKTLNQFVDDFLDYAMLSQNLKFNKPPFEYPENFRNLLNALYHHDLLKKYVHIDGLTLSSRGLSRRISFENNLDTAAEVYLVFEEEIESVFRIYMEDAKLKFKTK